MTTSSETPLLGDFQAGPTPPMTGDETADIIRPIELVDLELGLRDAVDTDHRRGGCRSCPPGLAAAGADGPVEVAIPAPLGEPLHTRVTRCMCCDDDSEACGTGSVRQPTEEGEVGAGRSAGSEPMKASRSLPSLPLASQLVSSSGPHRVGSATSVGLGALRHGQRLPSHTLLRAPSSVRPGIASCNWVFPSAVAGDSDPSLPGSHPSADICRICHSGGRHQRLIGPCLCAGSMRFTHQSCLTTWLAQSGRSTCELCGYKFKTQLVGSRNIFQWKVLRVSFVDKLHLTVLCLSLLLFAGTSAYIGWTTKTGLGLSSTVLSTGTAATSLAGQILLPIYASLCLLSLMLVAYETKNTCLRLARRWRALNMGLVVVERALDEEEEDGDGDGNDAGNRGGGCNYWSTPPGTSDAEITEDRRAEPTGAEAHGVPSDWTVWSARESECQSDHPLSAI